ncbi:MAG: hypothetical protein KGZ30_01915 [Anaplasmataceae bacterium]|nr:hypothetical protein [Anaplasmataceae bacterium]
MAPLTQYTIASILLFSPLLQAIEAEEDGKIHMCPFVCLKTALSPPHQQGNTESDNLRTWQLAYLARSGKLGKAIDDYFTEYENTPAHHFEILQQFGMILLDQGAHANDPKKQLASIYGAHLAGIDTPLDVLEEGIRSRNPETQLACIQSLASFQDDRCDDLLLRAMSSAYLPIRLEAGFYLAMRKHPSAAGQLESLLNRVPPFFRFLFPDFFALIGTQESMSILRSLMDDEEISCRTEAILSAARNGRDDLLVPIRKRANQQNHAIQEASSTALMMLQDTSSIARLKQLTNSSSAFVRLAAARTLVYFGYEEAKLVILELIKERNIYAIQVAGELEIHLDLLNELTTCDDFQAKINASIALLQARDERALPVLFEILLRDTRDLGIAMVNSPGRSLHAWKIIPSLSQRQEPEFADLHSITLAVREHFLRQCLDLGEKKFLKIAQVLLEQKAGDLIPLLCILLENLRTPEAIALLQDKANTAGFPLIRTYAALTLFRLGAIDPYKATLKSWLLAHNKKDILQFRPLIPFHRRLQHSPHELTPEETSRLLIEIYQAFADQHSKEGIDLILKAIRQDSSINRYALAGLLLRALQ